MAEDKLQTHWLLTTLSPSCQRICRCASLLFFVYIKREIMQLQLLFVERILEALLVILHLVCPWLLLTPESQSLGSLLRLHLFGVGFRYSCNTSLLCSCSTYQVKGQVDERVQVESRYIGQALKHSRSSPGVEFRNIQQSSQMVLLSGQDKDLSKVGEGMMNDS